MGNCCPNCFICLGVYILAMAGLLTVGFNFLVKKTLPIAMWFLPLNETLQLWIEIPLALDIKAILTNVSTSSDISNRTLGLGQLGFKVEMAAWTEESGGVFPIVWMEEEAAIDKLMRYLLVLSDGPLNYAKYYTVAFAFAAFGVAFVGALLRFKKIKS